MRNERPRLLPSAERYAPVPPTEYIDPNVIERAAIYLSVAEFLDPAAVRPLAPTEARPRPFPPMNRANTARQETDR